MGLICTCTNDTSDGCCRHGCTCYDGYDLECPQHGTEAQYWAWVDRAYDMARDK